MTTLTAVASASAPQLGRQARPPSSVAPAAQGHTAWKAPVPLALAALVALLPAPAGLAPHAWLYFAIFAGVIAALMLEPLPGGAIGLIGVTLITLLAPWVLYSPAQLAAPGFKPANDAIRFALSGFANTTVWLIFGAFMFAEGYEKTGLGKRIALVLVKALGGRTLTLGYAIAIADLLLAPFTPSNTARSAGTLYPIIKNLPPLYDSKPNDPSARRIGSYLMWTAIAATCVTSSMFLTALAPNLLALDIAEKTLHVKPDWMQWFVAFAPAGLILLLIVPALAYVVCPPEVKAGGEVPKWAAAELTKLGPLTKQEITLLALVLLALGLWIFGGRVIDPTTAALTVICLMLLFGVITWQDMLANKQAWNTLAWFATLVVLAEGLTRVGFVKWFAGLIGAQVAGLSPLAATLALVAVFFALHYLFASVTAHVTALLPVMLAVGTSVPGIDPMQLTLLLVLSLGIMGIITPFGTGPSPVYYGSGYLPSALWWKLGALFGVVYFAVYLMVTPAWMSLVSHRDEPAQAAPTATAPAPVPVSVPRAPRPTLTSTHLNAVST
jgi:L-tartrate/succinate antiporter